MKILVVHNHYMQPGGEDQVVQAELQMLKDFGHEVIFYEKSNDEIKDYGLLKKFRFVLSKSLWNDGCYDEIKDIIREKRPDVAHFHNTFLVISPSAFDACFEEGVPIVLTLHNYRFLCPNGLFYRDGHLCYDCLRFGKNSALKNRCWRNSFVASGLIARVVSQIDKKGTVKNRVSQFIALSEFEKKMFVDHGFPENKITIKPNFLKSDPGWEPDLGDYVLFIGTLRNYKGVRTLIDAWDYLKSGLNLKIIGEGPLLNEIKKKAVSKNIEILGYKSFDSIFPYIKKSMFVVVPSECFETFSRVTIEAYACGKPVVASRLGVFQEMVEDHKTGLLFKAGDSQDLASKIDYLFMNKDLIIKMGKLARERYEAKYTRDANYPLLMNIYSKAMTFSIKK